MQEACATVIELLLAAVFMAVKDFIYTLLTVAEARGRSWTAAGLDAAGDLAGVGVTLYGAGLVIQHGWTPHVAVVLAVMMATSFFGTACWTRVATRWMPVSKTDSRK